MGTTLEVPPGVMGVADGAFLPKSLLKPLFPVRRTKRKINDPRAMMEKSHKRGTYIIHQKQITKIQFLWIATA